MTDSLKPYLTPPEIAKLLRVSSEKVLGWIRKAELTAINVGDGNRPRYRVRREDLDSFLGSREVQPPAPRIRRNHRMDRASKPPEGCPIDPVLGKELAMKGQTRDVFGKYYRIWNGATQFF
jgi:excisionase family DNA binding protein